MVGAEGRAAPTVTWTLFQQVVFRELQLDELHARVRREGVQWLWVALDPVPKVIPTLSLGPRTPEAAMQVVHQLVQVLAPGCVPAFTTDGLRTYFYALTAHFGQWVQVAGQRKANWQVSDNLLHGQLVKRKGQARFAVMRMAWGKVGGAGGGAQSTGVQKVDPDGVCGAGVGWLRRCERPGRMPKRRRTSICI